MSYELTPGEEALFTPFSSRKDEPPFDIKPKTELKTLTDDKIQSALNKLVDHLEQEKPESIEDIKNPLFKSLARKISNAIDINKLKEEFYSQANEGQKIAFDEFIKNAEKFKDKAEYLKVFTLQGSAGCGKTWLTAKIIAILDAMGIKVNVSAPTHEALRVIREMLAENKLESDKITSNTIHSFLNLKLDYGLNNDDPNAVISEKPKLVPNKNEFVQEVYTEVLLVDESSMVNDELYNLTLSVLDDRAYIILFIGDACQLKPVEGGENFIFDREDINHLVLEETVRQKAGSQIIDIANQLKYFIKNKQYPATISNLFNAGPEVVICEHSQFLPTYFSNENSKMVGSYTNKTVESYNNYIRHIDTNGNPEYIDIGDVLVLQQPYVKNGIPCFQNGEIVTVEKVTKKNDIIYDLEVYSVYVQDSDDYMYILRPESVGKFQQLLDAKKREAIQAKGYDRKKAWATFFKLKERYANIRYNFARTIHKLQGSTYVDMFFDMRDLEFFYKRDPDTILRLIYVGITRAKEKVYIAK